MSEHPHVRAIAMTCTAGHGRPRKVPLTAVMAIAYLHAMTMPTHMTVTAMLETLDLLGPSQREQLGVHRDLHVRHKHLWGGLRRIAEHVRDGLTVAHHPHGPDSDCPAGCPGGRALTEDEVGTAVVQASLPPGFEATGCVAVDGTDVEIHSVPFRTTPGVQGWVCADHDASWGKRTATDRRPTEFYVGYEAHLATYIPSVGNPKELPLLCAGLALRPGVQERAGACVGVIKALSTFGRIEEVVYDRGYSTARPEKLAHPLHEMGIALTFDLHTSQRGFRAGPTPETIWVDGTLYSNALPEPLRDLDPPTVGDSPGEKAHRRDVFTARDAYALVRHSKPVAGRHARRFKGPALAGRVRCPNVPASMRLGHHLPTTSCERGVKCGCGITVSIPDTLYERDRQHLPWQSHAWAASYNRRTRIEGLNAQIRFQDLNVNRGFFRMLGRTSTMLLLAVTVAGFNATHLHDWYIGRGLPEPWAVELGEPAYAGPLRRYTRTRGRSSHAPPDGDTTTATPTTEQ